MNADSTSLKNLYSPLREKGSDEEMLTSKAITSHLLPGMILALHKLLCMHAIEPEKKKCKYAQSAEETREVSIPDIPTKEETLSVMEARKSTTLQLFSGIKLTTIY